MKTASERLARLSSQVKKKIFVVHTFPHVRFSPSKLNAAMGTGIHFNWEWKEEKADMVKAQGKLEALLKNCSKCEQFDYTPKFIINGTFYPYEPRSFMSYYTTALHFTAPALEMIRPIFTDICLKIGKQ